MRKWRALWIVAGAFALVVWIMAILEFWTLFWAGKPIPGSLFGLLLFGAVSATLDVIGIILVNVGKFILKE